MYKLIAIDVDDTLLNDDLIVTEGTKSDGGRYCTRCNGYTRNRPDVRFCQKSLIKSS